MIRLLTLILCAAVCESAAADTFRNYKITIDSRHAEARSYGVGVMSSDFTSGQYWGSDGDGGGNFPNSTSNETIYGILLKVKYPKKGDAPGDTFTTESTGGAAFPVVWRKKDGSELIFQSTTGIAPKEYFWMLVPITSNTGDRDRFFGQMYSEPGTTRYPERWDVGED
jgi:hypothetical protein